MTSPHRLPTTTLTGRHVVLEPLTVDHVDGLVAAAAEDRTTYDWTLVPSGHEQTRRYVDDLLADAEGGLCVPFVQRRCADGTVVGATRYLDLHYWRRRATPDAVEVGGTWLAASAQRTAINTEAKLLLLGHAFDTLAVERVAICTDANNTRSRAAIERLGARFEGVLRNYRTQAGPTASCQLRDTALYAVTAAEWPELDRRLRQRLAGDGTPTT